MVRLDGSKRYIPTYLPTCTYFLPIHRDSFSFISPTQPSIGFIRLRPTLNTRTWKEGLPSRYCPGGEDGKNGGVNRGSRKKPLPLLLSPLWLSPLNAPLQHPSMIHDKCRSTPYRGIWNALEWTGPYLIAHHLWGSRFRLPISITTLVRSRCELSRP